ncbi:MAG: Ig-like domain-containing protein [Gemmatimonadota bacterium]|nr:Ig-like domain-containing protein [Gemmatimonadota bacterium]
MSRTSEASRGFLPSVGGAALIGSMLVAACENPQPPGLCGTIPEQTVVVGETATVSACFDDANGDMLSFGVSTSDPGTATVRASGSTVTVTAVAPGTAFMTVTATDVTGLSGNQQFRVLVPNRAPIVLGAIDARELPAGESADVDVSGHFAEPDGQELRFAFSVSDESIVSISADGPVVTIAALAKGNATVTVTATDPGGLAATQSFRATVPNRAPAAEGSMPEQTIEVGASAAMDVAEYFSDPDGDALAYKASSSDATVVVVSISGADLTVGPIAKGAATVTLAEPWVSAATAIPLPFAAAVAVAGFEVAAA